MDLSIIIPNYNTCDLLDRCLRSIDQSLKQSKLTYEIIVIDNASDEGSKALLNSKYPRIIKVFNKTNLGYGTANNQGIKAAHGKSILLLNTDIKVLGGSIESLYEFSKKYPDAFIGGKLYNEDDTPQASCGPRYGLLVVFLMLFCKGDSIGLTRYSPAQVKRVGWVSGACLIGRKNSFTHVGLFDEGIFMYMEEIEFLHRAGVAGHDVLFFPEAHFVHTGAASSGSRRTPVLNIYKGLIYYYHKHMSPVSQFILNILLRTKALAAMTLGRMIGRRDLYITYEEAYRLV